MSPASGAASSAAASPAAPSPTAASPAVKSVTRSGPAAALGVIDVPGPSAASSVPVPEWTELVPKALVGTKRGFDGTADGATALLDAAAFAVIARAVGRPPVRLGLPAAAPVPEDDRPLLSAAADQHLHDILLTQQKYLPEWLSLARAAGCRVPVTRFAALLDQGRTSRAIRPDLAALLGEPGRWLAAAYAPWRYLTKVAPVDGAATDATLATEPEASAQEASAASSTTSTSTPTPSAAPEAADFTSKVAETLAKHGIGREVHRLLSASGNAIWPEPAARAVLDALAAQAEAGPLDRSMGWITENLLTAVADHTPISLRGHLARIVARQAVTAAAQNLDLAGLLDQLDFRVAMHAELFETEPAASNSRDAVGASENDGAPNSAADAALRIATTDHISVADTDPEQDPADA